VTRTVPGKKYYRAANVWTKKQVLLTKTLSRPFEYPSKSKNLNHRLRLVFKRY